MSAELVAVLMLGGVLTLVLTGFPIAFVIGSIAFIVGVLAFGPQTAYHILYSRFYGLSLNYPYLAVPLFSFMGVVLQHSGITKELYNNLYPGCNCGIGYDSDLDCAGTDGLAGLR